MNGCEICGEPTSRDHSDEPENGDYFVWVVEDDEVPDGALERTKFEFCSLSHARLFVPPVREQRGNA